MNFDYFYNKQSEIYNFTRLSMLLMEDEILRAFLLKLRFCIKKNWTNLLQDMR